MEKFLQVGICNAYLKEANLHQSFVNIIVIFSFRQKSRQAWSESDKYLVKLKNIYNQDCGPLDSKVSEIHF